MSKFERSRLLNFLSKPRYGREIADHLNVPVRLANYHLQEAIKSGQVLVSEKRVRQTLLKPNGKLEKLEGFLYVSQNSPFLVSNVLKLAGQKVEKTSRSKTDVVSIKFVSKTRSLAEKKLSKQKGWDFLPRRADTTRIVTVRFKSKKDLVSRFLNSFVSKTRLARRRVWNQRLGRGTLFNRGERKSLSHIEKLCLFQALSDQPLPFLDVRRRFGVSKRTFMGFVKRGFIEEVWGLKNIGVKFKLTEKGETYLKRLEEASHFEHQQWKKIFLHLKQQIFS